MTPLDEQNDRTIFSDRIKVKNGCGQGHGEPKDAIFTILKPGLIL
jgi:hypothetical protein